MNSWADWVVWSAPRQVGRNGVYRRQVALFRLLFGNLYGDTENRRAVTSDDGQPYLFPQIQHQIGLLVGLFSPIRQASASCSHPRKTLAGPVQCPPCLCFLSCTTHCTHCTITLSTHSPIDWAKTWQRPLMERPWCLEDYSSPVDQRLCDRTQVLAFGAFKFSSFVLLTMQL